MARIFLRSKIHRATVTETRLDYEGSITLDPKLMDAAGILPYEKVHVLNITNGERFETYAIPGPSGRGRVCINGAAARLAEKGDLVIVLSYEAFDPGPPPSCHPRIVKVDAKNRVRRILKGRV